jgi:hypothetical protein
VNSLSKKIIFIVIAVALLAASVIFGFMVLVGMEAPGYPEGLLNLCLFLTAVFPIFILGISIWSFIQFKETQSFKQSYYFLFGYPVVLIGLIILTLNLHKSRLGAYLPQKSTAEIISNCDLKGITERLAISVGAKEEAELYPEQTLLSGKDFTSLDLTERSAFVGLEPEKKVMDRFSSAPRDKYYILFVNGTRIGGMPVENAVVGTVIEVPLDNPTEAINLLCPH